MVLRRTEGRSPLMLRILMAAKCRTTACHSREAFLMATHRTGLRSILRMAHLIAALHTELLGTLLIRRAPRLRRGPRTVAPRPEEAPCMMPRPLVSCTLGSRPTECRLPRWVRHRAFRRTARPLRLTALPQAAAVTATRQAMVLIPLATGPGLRGRLKLVLRPHKVGGRPRQELQVVPARGGHLRRRGAPAGNQALAAARDREPCPL